MYRTLNPATGELVEEFPLHASGDVARALAAAAAAQVDWSGRAVGERAALLSEVAARLDADSSALAALMALEMGKPVGQGLAEAEKCAWVCRYYAENAEAFLRSVAAESDGSEAWVLYEPLGVIFAIMPWNFPLWQVFRAAAPALAAGNTVVMKHAPNTPQCARRIEAIFAECGLPPAAFRNLRLSNEQAAEVIGHAAIRGVTLTGSSRAGAEVAQAAGAALKPMLAELGGSDPFVVFDDAPLEEAVAAGLTSRLLNNGQSCIAAKRFLVHEAALESFTERFVAGMEAQVTGDPAVAATTLGPLAREDLRDCLTGQVDRSRAAGASVLTGGSEPGGDGFFYPPTVLTEIPPAAPAATEELFGPVAALIPFATDAEAVAIANQTRYGLGASIWTRDRRRIDRLIPQIAAGSVFVNGMVKSDPRLPFGGIKDSGWGRELGREGMLEFLNIKTVWIG